MHRQRGARQLTPQLRENCCAAILLCHGRRPDKKHELPFVGRRSFDKAATPPKDRTHRDEALINQRPSKTAPHLHTAKDYQWAGGAADGKVGYLTAQCCK